MWTMCTLCIRLTYIHILEYIHTWYIHDTCRDVAAHMHTNVHIYASVDTYIPRIHNTGIDILVHMHTDIHIYVIMYDSNVLYL